MKCPHCGYVSFSETDKCKKCGNLLPREKHPEKTPHPAESVELRKDAPPAGSGGDLPLNRVAERGAPAGETAISAPAASAPPPPKAPVAAPVPSIVPAASTIEPAMKPPSKPSPPPASETEWKSAVKKRVQERFEKSTPRNAAPEVAPHVAAPHVAAPHVAAPHVAAPPGARVDRPAEAPPAGAASRVPPAAPAQHETSRIPQIAGPYDTTVEMGPARRMAPKEKDAEPPAKKVDQIPLFPEQVDKPAPPSRKGTGHLADRPIRLGAEALGDEEGEANEPPAGRKAAACILDALLVAIPWAVSLFSVERMLGTGIWPLLQQSWIPFVILFVLLHMMYAVFFIPALGETPGMAVSGIRLTGDGRMRWPRTVMFALVCLLSLAAVGSGFIWAVFDPDRRSWPELASNARFTRR